MLDQLNRTMGRRSTRMLKRPRISAVCVLLVLAFSACNPTRGDRSALDTRNSGGHRTPRESSAIEHGQHAAPRDTVWAGVGGSREGARHEPANQLTDSEPASVLRHYYDAINARDYARAYGLWTPGGPPGHPSLGEFARGYADTRSVQTRIRKIGRIEGAAGSQYVRISVLIVATQRNGVVHTYAGSYTLRRTTVPGGEEGWRLYTATIKRS